jgi:hypothetical protein
MGTWNVDCEDEASMAEDMKCQTGCSRRGHDLCWVRSQDRSKWPACTFWAYISNTALVFCSHFFLVFQYPRSEAAIVCSMRVVPLTRNSFGVTHALTPLWKG